jgi:hypothetical protein
MTHIKLFSFSHWLIHHVETGEHMKNMRIRYQRPGRTLIVHKLIVFYHRVFIQILLRSIYYSTLRTLPDSKIKRLKNIFYIIFKEFYFQTFQTGSNGDLRSNLKIHTPRTILNITKKVFRWLLKNLIGTSVINLRARIKSASFDDGNTKCILVS